MPGFGSEPPGRGARGFRADQAPPSQSDDLHAIKLRYCGPETLLPQPFSFAANQGQRYDLTGTPINQIILTVMTGQVNGYFGDNSSGFGKAAVVPHIVGNASIIPMTEIIPIAPGDNYIFTLQEGLGGTATGTITFTYV
jgi:hypothetical protein